MWNFCLVWAIFTCQNRVSKNLRKKVATKLSEKTKNYALFRWGISSEICLCVKNYKYEVWLKTGWCNLSEHFLLSDVQWINSRGQFLLAHFLLFWNIHEYLAGVSRYCKLLTERRERAGGNNEISEGISKALFQRWCPGALAPGGFKAAGGRPQARQAASPALSRTSSHG